MAIVASVLCVPVAAMACGGLFCSAATTTGVPIDQNAERVIFEVNEGSVTTHVQLVVAGDAVDFAWVVPLPAVPTFGTTPVDVFQTLDALTQPTFILPTADVSSCPQPSFAPSSGGGIGCGSSSSQAEAGGVRTADVAPPSADGVTHHGTQVFGGYVADVVSGEDTAAVVGWLRLHDYNITDNMVPALDGYNAPGMVFAALKLNREAIADATEPISFTIPGGEPCVPLRLTRVSAQPLMGIQVTVLDDHPWVPMNYSFEPIQGDQLALYADGSTNYFAWVAQTVAAAGGQHFVQESVVDTQAAGQYYLAVTGRPVLKEMLERNRWASRYYTRQSPEDMTADPVFMRAGPSVGASAAVDLTDHLPLWGCLDADEVAARTPPPCANVFCGAGATCVESGASAACRCPQGQVSQQLTAPDGGATVTCVPATNPLGVTDATVGAGTAFDPCLGLSCGAGTCQLRGGFPVCVCEASAAAFVGAGSSPECRPVGADAVTRGTGAGPMPRLVRPRSPPPVDHRGPWLVGVLLLALVSMLGWLRRPQPARPPA